MNISWSGIWKWLKKFRKALPEISFTLLLAIFLAFSTLYVELYQNNSNLKGLYNQKTMEIQQLTNSPYTCVSEELETTIIIDYIKKMNPKCGSEVARLIANAIIKYSKTENISKSLIIGIIQVESVFNPFAVSKADARGLMQVIHDVNNEKFNKLKLHNVDYGIMAGVHVLKEKEKLIKNGAKLSKFTKYENMLYLYVGKDEDYVRKVKSAMGEYSIFRDIAILEETSK